MEHRERVLPFTPSTVGSMRIKQRNNQLEPPVTTVEVTTSDNSSVSYWLQGYQVTDTETHPEYRLLKRGVYVGDVGGPFFSQKWETKCIDTRGSISGEKFVDFHPEIWPDGKQHFEASYTGPILPLPPQQLSWPEVHPSSLDELDEFGATAISRCSPSNPTTDLSTTFGEIFKEGVPKVIGGTLMAWRSLSPQKRRQAIGDEYLNVEFGWKPFVSSLKDSLEGLLQADVSYENYLRDSGRLVRRRYEFPEEVSTEIKTIAENVRPWHEPSTSLFHNSSSGGLVYQTDKVSIRRWFSGAFSYYVPPITKDSTDQIARAVIMARKTLGISITPDTLWNLAPWSWAVDWFTNTGDIISNWVDWAIDNQVLMYGYIMEHKIHERTYTFAGNTGLQSESRPYDIVKVVETKIRRPATPYGFGLSGDSLTDRQKTIIAALGITKSK